MTNEVYFSSQNPPPGIFIYDKGGGMVTLAKVIRETTFGSQPNPNTFSHDTHQPQGLWGLKEEALGRAPLTHKARVSGAA